MSPQMPFHPSNKMLADPYKTARTMRSLGGEGAKLAMRQLPPPWAPGQHSFGPHTATGSALSPVSYVQSGPKAALSPG